MTGNTKLTGLAPEVLDLLTLAPNEYSADHLSIAITQTRGDKVSAWDVRVSWSDHTGGDYDAYGEDASLAAALVQALAELNEQ